MKKALATAIMVLCAFLNHSYAQDSVKVLDALYADFTTPDASAAALLGITPDKVQKPASAKELSAAILDATAGGNNISPGIAIEWAPLITFDRRFIVKDSANKLYQDYKHYKETRFARGFSLSFASVQDSNGSNVAAGISALLYDKTDPSTNDDYIKKVIWLTHSNTDSLGNLTNLMAEFENQTATPILAKLGVTTTGNLEYLGNNLDFEHDTDKTSDQLMDALAAEVTTPTDAQRLLMHQLVDAYLIALQGRKAIIENSRKNIRDIINKSREDFKKASWNAGILKLGMGNIWYSPDHSWKQLQAQKFSGYLSWAGRINDGGGLQKHTQFIALAQYTYNYNDSSTDAGQFTLGGRIVLGSNNVHGSFEIAYQKNTYKSLAAETARESTELYRSTVGLEFRMSDGLWVELATGIAGPPRDFLKSAGMLTFANVKYTFKKEARFKME